MARRGGALFACAVAVAMGRTRYPPPPNKQAFSSLVAEVSMANNTLVEHLHYVDFQVPIGQGKGKQLAVLVEDAAVAGIHSLKHALQRLRSGGCGDHPTTTSHTNTPTP